MPRLNAYSQVRGIPDRGLRQVKGILVPTQAQGLEYRKSHIQPAAKPGTLSTTPLCGPRHILMHQSNMLTGERDVQCPRHRLHTCCVPRRATMDHFRKFLLFRVQLHMNMCGLSSMGAFPAAGECRQILSYGNTLVCNKKCFHAVACLPEGRDSLSLSSPCCFMSQHCRKLHVSEISALVSRH